MNDIANIAKVDKIKIYYHFENDALSLIIIKCIIKSVESFMGIFRFGEFQLSPMN